MPRDRLGDGFGESIAIHRERRPRRHARGIGRPHDERSKPPHLLLQETDCVIELVAPKRVAADQFCQPIRFVDGRRSDRPHFVNGDWNAEGGGLPGRFAAGEATAIDMNHDQVLIVNC